jgi:hypothetical protein
VQYRVHILLYKDTIDAVQGDWWGLVRFFPTHTTGEGNESGSPRVVYTTNITRTISIYLSMPLQTSLDLGRFFSHLIFYIQSVGLLGRVISPSQGRYLHTDSANTDQTHADNHASSGILTHDPSVRVGEDSSCLRAGTHYNAATCKATVAATTFF